MKAPPRRVFVTHGEPAAANAFANTVRQQLGFETRVPAYRDQAALD